MQLQELKRLVEFNAVNKLMVTRYGNGWALVVLKDGEQEKTVSKDCALEVARGGVRKFMTLDVIAKLSKEELNSHQFTVC